MMMNFIYFYAIPLSSMRNCFGDDSFPVLML